MLKIQKNSVKCHFFTIKLKIIVQKGTGVSAKRDTLKLNRGRSKVEFHYVPKCYYESSSFPVYN